VVKGPFQIQAMKVFLLCSHLCLLTRADKGFEQSQYNGAAGSFGAANFAPPAGFGGFGSNPRGSNGYDGGNANSNGLEDTIPGIPGEDYPIFSEVPETSFFCDGQVDGGYYGDPEAECQAFHICANDGAGGLSKYSFLCPNGTLFQQQYFVCDWWFNVDCSTTEDFYSLNDEIAAEREANSPNGGVNSQYGQGQGGQRRGGSGSRASASSPRGSYAAPSGGSYSAPSGGSYSAPAGGSYSAPSGGSYSAPSGGSYSAPGGSNFGGISSGNEYSAPRGLGPSLGSYSRNPRGVDLESVLTPPPLPENFILEANSNSEDF